MTRKSIDWTQEEDNIKSLYARDYSQFDIGKMYGVVQNTISNQMVKMGIPTNPRTKQVNFCKCGTAIQIGSTKCVVCFGVEREDGRASKKKQTLSEIQLRFQEAMSFAAPGYYGDVRVEELVL